ncbi:hypothetical protein J479_2462 [Acinetobacter baumannii 1297]|nr:hypothetical protein J479_2462 [Acinetobacter baumannii 1297]
MAIISLIYPDNSFPYMLEFGIGSSFVGIIWYVYQAWPDKLLKLESYANKPIPLVEISKIFPPPFKVGVVGCSKSGKTTFFQKANFIRKPLTRTNEVYANVFQLPAHLSAEKKNLIIFDGDGKQHTQQFDIMNHVNLLIIFFDHNENDSAIEIVEERLKDHQNFFEQLKFHIKNCHNLHYIHLVLNKNDLWGDSPEEKQILSNWFNKFSQDLSYLGGVKVSLSFEHSNKDPDCIAEVLEHIAKYLGEFDGK